MTTSRLPFGTSDADTAVLAGLVSTSRQVLAQKNAGDAGEVRFLADAGTFALRQAGKNSVQAKEMALRSVAAEIASTWNDSDRSVLARMNRAMTLVDYYPETMAAFEQGRILRRHVDLVVECGAPLDAEARGLLDAAAVVQCEQNSPNRARPLLQMLAESLQPRTLTDRHQDAREHRRVRILPLEDGMAELIVTLPVTLAHAILDRLTRQASAVKDVRERARGEIAAQEGLLGVDDEPSPAEVLASDERTTDQIRADLLADMLLTTTPGADPHLPGDGNGGLGAIRAVVQVTVPVLTLLGRSDLPADLTGTSPIDPATARTLAGNSAGLDRILTHPITGAVLATDRYQPTADLKRFLRGRDHRCRFPGCRMPAIRSDIDHTRDHAHGGPTDAGNLAHLCRGHHTLKHATPWKVRQLPHGILEWTSPAGHTYTDHPPGPALPGATAASLVGTGTPPDARGPRDTGRPSVTFTPDGDPPPF
ncbi:DUF222 domain-containing protein [Microbacterium caowuchunii]|uniref:HNH endonuclease signature motif containing protein n=1 Tax=Microbacterium caowuchunii TaxID=2614638 RepID=UPI0012441FAB|nr:HNH endonuclease signature motif containing protein [Microbacterium caowuchunii]QEV98962.1 DUF222 domain-containing protein [Microbacterium caowuchunii]